MADPKKPRNPANALFGLDDVPISTSQGPRPSNVPRPAGTAPRGSGAGYGYTFGQPAVEVGRPAEAEASTSQQPPPPPGPAAEYAQGPVQTPPSGAPQYIYVQSPPPAAAIAAPASAATARAVWALIIILLAFSGVNLYLILTARNMLSKQSDQLTVLTRRADSSDDHYAQLAAKFAVTAERLGMTQTELAHARQLTLSIERQQRQAVTSLNAAIAQKASAQDVNNLQTQANAKFGTLTGNLAGTQKDLVGTQKDLDATKEALTGTKGELTGAIAHTHAELVALAHRTDRDYFEFHLDRGDRQKIGGVQVQLVKTNTKMNLYTVNLVFDDKRTQRKNESIDEPVFFYMEGAPSALELVVNHVTKRTVSGYISAPKGFIVSAKNVLTSRPTA
jgi:hypothetical protein